MKQFIISLIILLGITSCTNQNEPIPEYNNSTSENLLNNEAFSNLLCSIDSLDHVYPSLKSRDGFLQGAGTGLADMTGQVLGGHIGRWVGGTLGSLTGNPFGTFAGIVIGGRVGPYVVGAVASGFASMLLSCEAPIQDNDLLPIYDFSFIDNISDENDSIGFYHNMCMVKIHEHRDSYGYGIAIDKSKLYDDIVQYYKSIGIYDSELENPEVKQIIIDEITKICNYSIQYELCNINQEQAINSHFDYIISHVDITENEGIIYKYFSSKLVFKCASLESAEIQEYASDLNEAICNSDLPDSLKVELSTSAEFIVNSSLCWQQ